MGGNRSKLYARTIQKIPWKHGNRTMDKIFAQKNRRKEDEQIENLKKNF